MSLATRQKRKHLALSYTSQRRLTSLQSVVQWYAVRIEVTGPNSSYKMDGQDETLNVANYYREDCIIINGVWMANITASLT